GDLGERVAHGSVDVDGAVGEAVLDARVGTGLHREARAGADRLVVGEIPRGDPARVAVDHDLGAAPEGTPGDQDLLAGVELTELARLVARLGPDVQVVGRPPVLLRVLDRGLDRGL